MRASEVSREELRKWEGKSVKLMDTVRGESKKHGVPARLMFVIPTRPAAMVKPLNHKRPEEVRLDQIHLWVAGNDDMEHPTRQEKEDPIIIYDLGHERYYSAKKGTSKQPAWTRNPDEANTYKSTRSAKTQTYHIKHRRPNEVSPIGLTVSRLSKAKAEIGRIQNRRAVGLETDMPQEQPQTSVEEPVRPLPEETAPAPRPQPEMQEKVAAALHRLIQRISDLHEAQSMVEQCEADIEQAKNDLVQAIDEQTR